MTQEVFTASVSSRILSKVDRLFSNNLAHIFIELLQNARRAGAALVKVKATALGETSTLITVHDNGSGIPDFSKLLHLGDSGWNERMERQEDPAGMGFFCLVHSGATVVSGARKATISREQFLGGTPVAVEPHSPPMNGTQITFERPNDKLEGVKQALASVAKFGPIDVEFNGERLDRQDFLAGALRIKEVSGVRIGIFDSNRPDDPGRRANFHGNVIHIPSRGLTLDHVIPFVNQYGESGTKSLYVDLDILETSAIRLKLPDRSAVVEDDNFLEIVRQARIAMFEYLAERPVHVASFRLFEEAQHLGVPLKEAIPFLTEFYVPARDSLSSGSRFEGGLTSARRVNPKQVALVDLEANVGVFEPFTFEIAQKHFVKLPRRPVFADESFKGYSWYDALPVYTNFSVVIHDDGDSSHPVEAPAPDYENEELLQVVEKITLAFSLVGGLDEKKEIESFCFSVPFSGRCHQWYDLPRFLIAKDSPWAISRNPHAGPFDLHDAAIHIAFDSDNDGNASYDDQDGFEELVFRAFAKVLKGDRVEAEYILNKTVTDWDFQDSLERAKISEVKIFRDSTGKWKYEILSIAA